MSTAQAPQDDIAAIQSTLARHEDDLERVKRLLPEITGTLRQTIERITAEFVSTTEHIAQAVLTIHERQEADTAVRDTLVDDIAGIKEIMSVMDSKADAVIDRLDTVVNDLAETSSRLGNVVGHQYERRAAKVIRGRLRRAANLFQARVLHLDWGETHAALTALLDEAQESGTISEREQEDLLAVDIIAAGKNAVGQDAYAVVEIGFRVNSTHVNRAARRARTLAKAAGEECTAIVVGSEIPDTERDRALQASVIVITVAGSNAVEEASE